MAPTRPFIDAERARSACPPLLVAVTRDGDEPRTTPAHRHARGQLLGATRGLITVGAERNRWVVPATHAAWIPPHHEHSLESHGPFAGWSVYVAEPACADLPPEPCIVRTSGLLREAVARVSTWPELAPLSAPELRLVAVLCDEIGSLPREDFGLPMPTDPPLLRIARALLADLADNRRLEAWARWAGVSARTLTRRFPEETGFSFSEWRQRARLLRALELLAAHTPVTAIAIDLGYETVSAFSALFRRTFGAPPTKYFRT
ncbi:helix-turn-helix transcriptional regulator [Sorangium sp. So ce726]|uniref:AraC family transcriptional regulator n=1 Tax=Sorangium sp. So ce726 TaxID=3133319 RepID=UPI003F5EC23B